MSTIETLRKCEALAPLTDGELLEIASLGSRQKFAAGEVLMKEGDAAASFFFLLAGRVEISKGGHVIATLEPGSILGEMSLFNAQVRTSTVRALDAGHMLAIESPTFASMVLHQNQAAIKMMEALGTLMMQRMQARDAELLARVGERDGELADTTAAFAELRRRMMADWALKYHAIGRPGKLAIRPTKPVGTAADLTVAYSPGVAEPCLAIKRDRECSYEYTGRGNLVGVVTNGTAVLGLGDIGPEAAKPVMEGKAVLFKHFAGIDAFDIEIDEKDPQRFIDIVCSLAPTFGGINLEDVRAPECFAIERECQRRMDIPVFHDDQHGTAIIAGAGLLNALEIAGKRIEEVRVVFSGAGAAGFTCAKYFISLGVRPENLILCDVQGVVFKGRGDGNYLDELANDTAARTLAEAIPGADVFAGLSAGNLVTPGMLLAMKPDPIVFALANPTPEIDPGLARRTRPDVILATGRSDTPNQINNVIAFPYLFRGALDSRARQINEAMKRAATAAIATLAKEPVHPRVLAQSPGLAYGRNYFIPKPFDPRLITRIAPAVAEAAMASGVARKQLELGAYLEELEAQLLRAE